MKAASPWTSRGQHFLAVFGVAEHALAGAGLALHHGDPPLEMAWVRREMNVHVPAFRGMPGGLVAEMVFHVAASSNGVRHVVFRKFVEDQAERLVEEIGQHVEAGPGGPCP